MNYVIIEELNIIKQIFDGEIYFADKRFVNPRCDKIYREIEDAVMNTKDKNLIDLKEKYSELICLLEIERFAQGAKFMYYLCTEMNNVKTQ